MNEPKRTARRKKITELIKDKGAKPTPEELGVCRRTLYNDLTALEQQGQIAITEQDRKEMINAQYEVLLRMEKAAIEGTLDPDVINAWNRVRESIARLLGLNAESRSVVAHVSGAQLDSLYLDIRVILQDLDRADQEAALSLMAEFAKSRKKPVVVDAMILRSDNAELS